MFTTNETAAIYKVKRRTVLLWIKEGRLPGTIKRGRDWMVPESAISNFRAPNPVRDPRRKYLKNTA